MKKKRIYLVVLLFIVMLLFGTNLVNATEVNTAEAFHNFTGMYIKTTNVKPGEKVYVEYFGETNVTSVKGYLLNSPDYFTIEVLDLNTRNPYFIMPINARTGVTYELTLIDITCEHGRVQYSTSLGGTNFTNCFERKYVTVESDKPKFVLSNLSLASHYTTIKKGDRLWLDVEIKGEGQVGLVTMIIRNKENPNMVALVSLKEDNLLQYVDVFDGVQVDLEDGVYYISDLYINPDRTDYIRYSVDGTEEDAIKLEYNVEFTIKNKEDIIDDKVDNTIDNKTENKINNTITNTVENKVDNKVENKTENKIDNTVENKVDNIVSEKSEEEIIENYVKDMDEESFLEFIYRLIKMFFDNLKNKD